MSELREAAQEALFWMQHARLHLTIKERLHPDGLIQYDNAARNLRAALAQPEVEPPRDEWHEAVHAELVTTWTLSSENKDDPRKALQDIINWHVRVALDPAVSSDAQALIERGKAMRDGWRPASEPPEDGRDVVVWCAQERRAVHGMYVRRHPPVVGLVDGWVAPDASKLTHWRDETPPTEGE